MLENLENGFCTLRFSSLGCLLFFYLIDSGVKGRLRIMAKLGWKKRVSKRVRPPKGALILTVEAFTKGNEWCVNTWTNRKVYPVMMFRLLASIEASIPVIREKELGQYLKEEEVDYIL